MEYGDVVEQQEAAQNPRSPPRGEPPTGRGTSRPGRPARDLLGLGRRMKVRIDDDHLSIIAAGVAFYGLLAVFPALTALVALYGLLLDPQQVGQQLQALSGVLPAQVIDLLLERLKGLAGSSRGSLGFGAAGALLLALWSASAGTRTLILALNVAYDVRERRGVMRRAALSLLLTLGVLVAGIVSIAAVVVLPALLDLLGLDANIRGLLVYARWPVLAAMLWLGLLVVYRFAPNRRDAHWNWRDRGAAVALALWLAGSSLFSWYVENLANYDQTYGPLGAVVILLLWFLMSGYAVLLGAELNAELGHDAGPA